MLTLEALFVKYSYIQKLYRVLIIYFLFVDKFHRVLFISAILLENLFDMKVIITISTYVYVEL